MRLLRLLVALPAVLILVESAAGAAETMRLRADVWMPYNGEPAAAQPGYAIEVARTILARHDIVLDYQTMPWGDARKAAAAGEIEAIVGANREEAEGLVIPQECIGLPRVGLFVLKNNSWRYENVGALRSIRLGVIADYSYWPAFDSYIARQKPPQVLVHSGDQPLVDAIAALDTGKLDVLAETSSVFAWTAKQAGYNPNNFRLAYLHEGEAVFFCFTPRGDIGARYAQIFDEGIREMRRSGELLQILSRYGLGDWQ